MASIRASSIEGALERASEALALAQGEPRRAMTVAGEVLSATPRLRGPAATSMAHQAMGMASRSMGEIATAVAHLQRAVRVADRAGLTERSSEARLSLGVTLAFQGRTRTALHTLDAAAPGLAGVAAARLDVQRAVILWRVGRLDEALRTFQQALRVIRRHGDRLWEARVLNQRSLIFVERGAYVKAEVDLRRAESLFEALGQHTDAAGVRHNRGWCAARAGQVTVALSHYDGAEDRFRALGVPLGELPPDRCHLLLALGLGREAREIAEERVTHLAAHDARMSLAEALLVCSQAALLDDDPATALLRAQEAERAFRRQDRPGWIVLARYAATQAAWAVGDRSPNALREATRTAAGLERLGLGGAAVDARLTAGRIALAMGDERQAQRQLQQASAHRNRGPAGQRSRAWLAEAMLRLEAGRPQAADAALRAGMRVVNEHRTSMGATELRAAVSGAAGNLAVLGHRLALDSGRPERILAWIERWRAGALLMPPLRPPDDQVLAAELSELRAVASELEATAAAGQPTTTLHRRQSSLEQSIRRRARRTDGGRGSGERLPTVDALSTELGDAVLIEIGELDGGLHAVIVAHGRAQLEPLGRWTDVIKEIAAVRFSLRRLAYGRASPASIAAARASVAHSGDRLDDLLIGRLRKVLDERPLVVVPPASLHALPWSILPSCRTRPLTIVPSAALWLRAAVADNGRNDRVLLAAGPDLPGAVAEVGHLRRVHRGARCLVGQEATAAATVAALDGVGLAHLAAHGDFRADNPLFSCLRMADGPLTVYDLETLRQAPRQVVLSACDSGVSAVRPGDEVMGLAAAFISLGTAVLVTSVVPVPDGSTVGLMRDLHGGVARGLPMAEALVAARQRLEPDDALAEVSGAAFVCLGDGLSRPRARTPT